MSASSSTLTLPDLSRVPAVDQVGVEERAARFRTRSIKKDAKVEAMKMALSMIDLTTLEGEDTDGKVRQLCYKAMHLHDRMPGLPHVAAICVYPTLVKTARKALEEFKKNQKDADISLDPLPVDFDGDDDLPF